MPKIAIIEDDRATNDHLKKLLAFIPNAEIFQAFDRQCGEQIIAENQPDLVVVDIDLGSEPTDKYGGFQILSSLQGRSTVTLVVSGMPHENLPDVAISLRAYDFIGKPVNDLDFINKARHALQFHERGLMETPQSTDQRAWPPDLKPDPRRHFGLLWKGKPVRLSITHLRLVHCLLEHPGQPVDRAKLADQLDTSNSIRAVATHISDVRQRFMDVDPLFDAIDSEPGKGYVWKITA